MRSRIGRRAIVALTVAVVGVLVFAGCAPEGPSAPEVTPLAQGSLPDDAVAQIQAAVNTAIAATGSTGAIVGVWAPWAGSYVAGVGTQEPGGAGGDVKADMTFRASRITRAMTCDVLYRVAAQGTVSLDDSVVDYVGGVAGIAHVTLGELCDGTSMIGSYSSQLASVYTRDPSRVWDPHELASYGLGDDDTTATPGSGYRDSDAGYVLLGMALERATGRTIEQLLADDVFGPLGLRSTSLPDPAPAAPHNALRGYHAFPGGDGALSCAAPTDVTVASSSLGFTDSGVVTDIHDLGLYVHALATEALLPKGVDRFDDPKPPYANAPSWLTTDGGVLRAGSLVGQSGAVPGYATAAFSDPETGLTVAVVLNDSVAGSAPANDLALQLAALASKLPASAGASAPDAGGLPWTAEQYGGFVTTNAVCPIPAPAE